MQQEAKIDYSEFSPSFSYYSSEGLKTMTTVSKVIHEEKEGAAHEFDSGDFQFSFVLNNDKQVSVKEVDSRIWTVFPVFSRNLLVKYSKEDVVSASIITSPSRKLLVVEQPEKSSSSCSSSEADELENQPSKTFCFWRPKAYGRSSPKCKKSNSTSSGSKRGIIRYLFRRSNSEGKDDPNVLLAPKQKRNLGSDSRVATRLNSGVHEQFYVQRRAENEIVKKKSYLPYRQDLVGVFANVNKTHPF